MQRVLKDPFTVSHKVEKVTDWFLISKVPVWSRPVKSMLKIQIDNYQHLYTIKSYILYLEWLQCVWGSSTCASWHACRVQALSIRIARARGLLADSHKNGGGFLTQYFQSPGKGLLRRLGANGELKTYPSRVVPGWHSPGYHWTRISVSGICISRKELIQLSFLGLLKYVDTFWSYRKLRTNGYRFSR